MSRVDVTKRYAPAMPEKTTKTLRHSLLSAGGGSTRWSTILSTMPCSLATCPTASTRPSGTASGPSPRPEITAMRLSSPYSSRESACRPARSASTMRPRAFGAWRHFELAAWAAALALALLDALEERLDAEDEGAKCSADSAEVKPPSLSAWPETWPHLRIMRSAKVPSVGAEAEGAGAGAGLDRPNLAASASTAARFSAICLAYSSCSAGAGGAGRAEEGGGGGGRGSVGGMGGMAGGPPGTGSVGGMGGMGGRPAGAGGRLGGMGGMHGGGLGAPAGAAAGLDMAMRLA